MNPNLFRSHVQCKSRPSHSNKTGKKKIKHSQYFTQKKILLTPITACLNCAKLI